MHCLGITCLTRQHQCEEEFEVHVLETGQVALTTFKTLVSETQKDTELSELYNVVMAGWPDTKCSATMDVHQYWTSRDEITAQDVFLYKGDIRIASTSFRSEVMARLHVGHLGIDKCKIRARSSVFWPGITATIEQMVGWCSTCKHYQ